jgi:outer membrane protein OmpA-like peptidoglycan-associated protein
LTVTYDNGSSEQMESTKSFVVDTVAPKTSVTVSPVPFSPDGDGINETVTISMAATDSLAGIKDWTLDILDPMGHSFMKYSGTGAPPPSVVWDGHARSGELVQSGMDYSAVLTVTNEYGVTGTGGGVISVDILVIKEGDHYRIRVPSIYFGPNTSDLFLVDDTLLTKNLETLRRLAKILNRYEHYNILIQGNAVSVLWYNSKLAAEEQKETLIPLSRARAREVMKALAILGVDRHRISIEGLGGSNPIVPFSDLQNRWKDRRVEFLLTTPPSGVKPAKQ